MWKRTSIWSVVTIGCLTLLASVAHSQERVIIKGAGLLGQVIESYAQAYKGSRNKFDAVVIGSTSGRGIQAVTHGNAQMAMASRKITDDERNQAATKGLALTETLIGKISLVVITNSQIPIKELTIEQLRKIFSGEYTNWSQCGGPDAATRVTMRAVPATGAGVEFQRIVLGGVPYARSAEVMSLYKDTVTACRKSPAIGYIPTTSVFFRDLKGHGVKAIAVKKDANSRAIFPTEGVVKQTDYPITIPVYLVWNSKATEECIAGFADFCVHTVESTKVD